MTCCAFSNGKEPAKYQPITQTSLSVLVADEIRSSIKVSNLSPGDKLPPVGEMAKELGVSIPSVRKAITLLSAAGVVTSCKHRGTLVNYIRDDRGDKVRVRR